MSPATAGARMGKSAEEGQQLMDNFFAQFPKVRELMDASMADLIEFGYVEDWAGRRRHLPDINLKDYEVRALKESKEANFNPFLECADRGSSLDPQKELDWEAKLTAKKKENGAGRIFIFSTFGLFVDGLDKFDDYYKRGLIDKVFTTNLVYRRPELASRDWYVEVNMCKYVAYIIDNLNHDSTLSELLNPVKRIHNLMDKHKAELEAREK